MWAIDLQFDQTMDGTRLNLLNLIDECSPVCLPNRLRRRCQAVVVFDTIDQLLKLYPLSTYPQMDNGPEFIPDALQEWCIGSGTGTGHIPPGSPWVTRLVHSFSARFRDDSL